MKYLVSLAIILSITFTIPPGRVSAGDGGGFSGVTNCFIKGRWVTVRGNCPAAPSSGGGGTSSGGGSGAAGAIQGGFYSLGYSFGQWLVGGGGSNAQDEARRREMMAELQRRQAEAERQKREEEARRLAEIYNRLARTLKLSGTPELQIKGGAGSGQGLKLKIGDSPEGHAGIAGLPGMYLDNSQKSYGIPGLPGMYTGGQGQGSGLSASGLKLKIGEGTAAAASAAQTADAAPAPPALPAAPLNPADMTPRQLADVAEMFSRLPPEEQARLMTLGQKGPPAGTSAPDTAVTAAPGMSRQLPKSAPASLQQQSTASQAAASAPSMEDASEKARVGFDRPGDAPPPVRLETTGTTPSIPPPPYDGLDADAIATRYMHPAYVPPLDGPFPRNPGPRLRNPLQE